MKKILSMILVLTLALSVFVACGEPEAPAEKDYNLSVGVVVSETLAKSKVASTVAVIVTDADGKIVLCRLDCVEYAAYNADGIVTTAPASKVAQGENYDPYGAMAAGDWYKQSKALENYVVGMTQTQVSAIELAGGYVTDAELKASCSIGVTDLLKAIDNAFKSEHKVAFKSTATTFTAGLDVSGTVSVTEKDGTTKIKHSATFAAAVLADGVVVAAVLDTAEPELVGVTTDGSASLSYKGSKREQGDNYDPYGAMAAGDWYVQADVYAKTAVGKTAANIATLASEGVAGCTIGVTAYKAGLEAAVNGAR